MNEPEDPGGTTPQVSNYVTICSGMETEGSILETDGSECSKANVKRKRISNRKVCKHCNKRKRSNHKSGILVDTDCNCKSISDTEQTHKLQPLIDNDETPSKVDITKSPSSSSQNQDLRPLPVGRVTYQQSDIAPYIVHVQKEQTEPSQNTTIHPISFGHFLKKSAYSNIINGSLKKLEETGFLLLFQTMRMLTNS